MSEVFNVFYCWQSDTKQNHCRHLIREALDSAADRISVDATIPYRLSVHSDTENEPGLCNIPETILRSLREADAIVSDLTFIATTATENPKHCSNPNVLFELGYAFNAIGPERIICVMNEAHGDSAKQVFDLAHHRRPITYTSPREGRSRANSIDSLSQSLEDALRGVIKLGLSGGRNGDDEIMHQRQLSEVEEYWRGVSTDREFGPRISVSFRPKLFREKRWPDAEIIEEKVRELAIRDRSNLYPPQPRGSAPMNWGLYNDTYGDPWTLTYAGQFWTEFKIGGYGNLKLSLRDATVSPEPPSNPEIPEGQWVQLHTLMQDLKLAFKFYQNVCTVFADSESVRWSLNATDLAGMWLNIAIGESRGPSKARTIERNGEMLVSEFKLNWIDVYSSFAKDFCDVFCRDGRNFSLDNLKNFA